MSKQNEKKKSRFLLIVWVGENLGERSSGMNWILPARVKTESQPPAALYSFINLFIPQQGSVADSFFIYNFMPLNHLVDRRSVGGALSVRGNLSGVTDDADRCNETLCYLDSVVQSVIEVPASFIISHRRSNWFLCERKCHWNIRQKKKISARLKPVSGARHCARSRLVCAPKALVRRNGCTAAASDCILLRMAPTI